MHRRVLLLGVAAMAPWICRHADAQSDANASGPEPALEEVVITAQKRPERLEEVPVAAAVVSNATLQDLDAVDISDLSRLVPSLNLNGSFNGRVPLEGPKRVWSGSVSGTVTSDLERRRNLF